jgi:hypothetical protein
VIVKMDPLPSEWASQRVAVLPPMTIMHVPKRSRHPKAPTNEEEAGRNPNQKHHEERLHGQTPFIPHRPVKRPIKPSFPCVNRKAGQPLWTSFPRHHHGSSALQLRDPVRVESHMRGRVFRLLYLTAIAVAMIGWLWLLIEAIARSID